MIELFLTLLGFLVNAAVTVFFGAAVLLVCVIAFGSLLLTVWEQ